ncbi:phage-related minor tail protein [Clostridium puniceum]|uniref:Phage-related minor tail protein n=1 Tax=Clostridium puniceum TaxID=29367 RepID=A0A1S8TWW5_9CLOT|nr:phage tail tape measure protein [Clostridium puniceum]OOM82119.1 phage-related minor tail protein [Clostridium puniceum]
MSENKQSILIGIRFDDINKVKSNLQKQLDGIKGISAKIDTASLDVSKIQSSIQTQLNSMNFIIKMGKVDVSGIDTVINKTKQATQEAQQYKNVMGKSLNIGDGAKAFDDLQRRANEIRNTVDSLAKISFNTTKNGGVKDATITYTDNMGKLVTETMKWKQVMNEAEGVVKNVFTTTNVKVSDNVQQLGKLEAKIESIKTKMQSKLSTANAMGIDPALITQLQTQLNNISVSTPINKINQLQTQINALGNNGSTNINKLQGAINTLSNRVNNIKATKMDIINSNDITELQKAEAHIINLKQLLSQVKSGKIIDGKVISAEVSTARNSVNQLSSAINNVKANASSLGTIFKSVFSYAIGGGVIFAGLNQLRQGLKDIKNIDDSLRDLKRVSSDVADTTLNNFVGKANEMGISLGRTTEDAITATATFKQLGYSFKEASEYMAKNSLILSNVGDMSASDSASSLVSILKGFKLEAKDTTKVVDILNETGNRFALTTKDLTEGLRIGGASLALANNDLAQSTALIATGTEVLRDSNMVANGLKTISMRIRGVKDEEGELVPTMREDLKSIADIDIKNVNGGFKSTYEIVKSLGEKWSTFSDIQKANLSEEIAGKNRANVFAGLMQNYQQLDKVYQMVGQSAGSAQKEQESYINGISGKLNTFKETVKATWINLTDTNGIKSLLTGTTNVVGGLNDIIKTFGAMPTVIMSVVGAMTIFNTKFRESMTIYQPSFLTNLTGGLNNLKATWAGVSKTATENIRTTKQNITYMNQMGMNANSAKVQLAGYQVQLGLANMAQKACAVSAMALQMAFSMGLSLAISFAISKVMELVNAQENLKKSNEEAISSYKTEKEAITSATNLLKEKKDLENQINSTNEGTKENKDLKEKLLEVERQLATALPNSTTQYDAQGKAIATSNKQIEEQIKLKKQAMLNDTLKQLDDNNSGMSSISWSPMDIIGKGTNMGYGATTLESIDETIEKYKQLKEEAKKASEEATTSFGKNSALEDLQRYSKMLDEAMSKDSQYKILIMNAIDAGKSTSELAERFGVSEDAIKRYSKSIEDNTGTQKENSNESEKVADKTKIVATAMKELNSGTDISKESLEALQKAYPTMGISAENAKDSVQKLNDEISKNTADEHAKDIQKATEAYAKATQEISKCNGFIDRLNKSQAMTPAIASAISKAYPEIGDNINKVATAQEFLNKKIKEEQLAQASAYEVMEGDSEQFYQNKIASNQEYQNAYKNLLSAFVSDGQKADDIDFGNYRTLNELKQGTQHQFGVAIENWLVSFVGESAKGYATDFDNFRSTAEQKASVLNKLNQEIKKINSNLAGAEALKEGIAERHKFDFLGTGDPRVKGFDDDVLKQVDSNVDKWKAKANELNGAIQEVDTKFNEFGASMKGFSGGGLGGTSDFSGTGGSDKKGKEKKDYTQEINDLKSDITPNRYLDLENAIKGYDSELEVNKSLQESLEKGSKEYRDSQLEQIELEKQKQIAVGKLNDEQKKESEEMKTRLASMSFQFDANGKLINSQQRLLEMQESINAESGDSEEAKKKKESDIKWLKDLQKYTEDYTNLVDEKIPKATADWNKLGNEIQSTTNEMEKADEDALKKLRDDLVNGLKKQREKEKEDKLEKLDDEYDKKKEKIQKEYDTEKKRLQDEKEAEQESYEKRIKALEKQISDLDEAKEDKAGKLKLLQAEFEDWGKDNSSYALKNKNDLAKEIKDLQIDIQKDALNKQKDSLTEQKENSSKHFEDEIKETDDYYKKELDNAQKHYDSMKKRKEKHYKEDLDEKQLYADADLMITEKNSDAMLKVLNDSSESYKEVGSLCGENFKEAFLKEIEEALDGLQDITGIKAKKSSSSSSKSKEVKVGDSVKVSNGSGEVIDNLQNGTAMSSSGSWGQYSGDKLKTVGYNNGYFKVANSDGNVVGWARRDDIAKFETGGRTPDNLPSEGKQAILHGGEKILNKQETEDWSNAVKEINNLPEMNSKFDKIYEWIKNNDGIMTQLSSTFADLGRWNISPKVTSMDLNSLSNRIVNNNNNSTGGDTSNVKFENHFSFTGGYTEKSGNDIMQLFSSQLENLGGNKRRG